MPARRPFVVGLVIFVAALIAVNGYYFFRSQSPTYWDDSSYLLGSLNLYDALTDHGVLGFGTAFAHLFGNKAPLICAFPLPVYLLLGRDSDPRFIVGVGFLIVMSVYLFWIGEKVWSPKEGLLAVVILQTMPLMYGLSRQFLADYGLATIVVMWMYYLMCFRDLNDPGAIVRLGLLLGAGMLMKVTFPMYVIAPTLVFVYLSLRNVKGLRDALRAGRSLACIVLIGAIVAGSWYALNWSSILGFAVSAGFGKLSINYGDANVFSPRVVWDYIAGASGKTDALRPRLAIGALSTSYSILLLSLPSIWVVVTWPKILKLDRSAFALWLWMVIPLAITTFGVNKDPRYTAPVMPVIALALAHIMTDLFDRRPLLRPVAALLLTVPILAYAAASLPVLGFMGQFNLGRWVFWSPHLAWYASIPDASGDWGQREMMEAVCRDALHSQPGARVFIPLAHQYLNNSNLSYLSSRLKCDVQILGLPQEIQGAKEVANWINGVKPSYVLVVPNVPEPELAPPFANRMKEEAERIVTRQDSGFGLMYRGSLGGTGKEILIYRRALNDS